MSWQDFPLKGFAPDLPNTEPGTFIVTRFAVPTDRGMGNGPMFTECSISAMVGVSLGGASLYTTAYVNRVYVGDATKLYEATPVANPTTLTDRSGATYNATTTNTWSFTEFGDTSLAVNLGDILQKSTGGAFSAVGTAPVPKASIVVVVGPASATRAMVFDFDDGTHVYRDGWFAAGLGGGASSGDWVTGTSECALGRLTDDIPGQITAAIPWRDGVLAFKRGGMYLGTYVGSPLVWQWERLSGDIGCVGKNAVCRVQDVVYWASDDAIWRYDGSYPQKVPGYIHNYWATHAATLIAASETNRNFFRVMYDKPKHLLWVLWGYASDQSTTTDGTFIWDLNIGGIAWNSISGLWLQEPWNPFSVTQDTNYAVEVFHPRWAVSKNKKISQIAWSAALTEPRTAILASWIFSDRVNTWTIKGVRPQWATDDTTQNATMSVFAYTSQASLTPEGGTAGTGTAFAYRSPGKFDGTWSGNDIGFQLFPTGGAVWEMLAVSVDAERLGKK